MGCHLWGRTESDITEATSQQQYNFIYSAERVPGCDSTGVAERSYPTSKARGGGREEQPHVQGAVAVQVQEGREELFHVQCQEGRP